MEKKKDEGVLLISKGKKGKLSAKIQYSGEKTVSVSSFKPESEEYNNKEVFFLREKGQVILIESMDDGKEIFKKNSQAVNKFEDKAKRNNNFRRNKPEKKQPGKAIAPYNFVPINQKVVEYKTPEPSDRYHPQIHTGYIDIEVLTKTPLYIRDTLTAEEDRKLRKAGSRKTYNDDNPDFFSPGGKIRIPGSSVRGMTRTLVEIASFGKMEFFDEKRLYYRAVAERSSLGTNYMDIMIDIGDNYYPKIKSGILKKEGHKYKIYPSKTIKNTQIYRLDFSKCKLSEFEFKEIYFKPVEPKLYKHTIKTKKGPRIINLKYAKIDSIEDVKKDGLVKGYLVASGKFAKKKHMHWVINEPDPEEKYLKIDKIIIDNYEKDINRDERANLLRLIQEHKDGVPCFYITDKESEVIAFGHTGMFRLPYENSIGDHIPQDHKKDIIDIPKAIFGDETKFASRVFFEDAFLTESESNNVLMGISIPKILSEPKPTCFQHYLNQEGKGLDSLNFYNGIVTENNCIRGNKLYWHFVPGEEWIEKDKEEIDGHDTQYTRIKPVKAGTTFKGRIRFENLDDIELGALLFVMELPDGCCHKLGMGKPLGLGSAKITPHLFLSDRQKRYADLFYECSDENKYEDQKISEFKRKFEEFILKQLKQNISASLWDNPRMKHLKAMLNFEAGNQLFKNGKIRYMEIEHRVKEKKENEYKNRPVLPTPVELIQEVHAGV